MKEDETGRSRFGLHVFRLCPRHTFTVSPETKTKATMKMRTKGKDERAQYVFLSIVAFL
jgi:hypothetical protein